MQRFVHTEPIEVDEGGQGITVVGCSHECANAASCEKDKYSCGACRDGRGESPARLRGPEPHECYRWRQGALNLPEGRVTEQVQAAPPPSPDPPRACWLPVWALPVVGLGVCTAISWLYGAVGAGIAVAVLATVAIATVGADFRPDPRGRHIAQAVALIVAAAIVALAYLRVGVTQTDPGVRSGEAPLDLRNRQLSVSDLQGKVLRGAQLQGATLSGLDLSGVDLSGANLSGAYLTATDLAGAHLNGINLRGADLREACLRGSVLDGADLTDVNAGGADVSGAAVSQSAIVAARAWPATSTGIGVACR